MHVEEVHLLDGSENRQKQIGVGAIDTIEEGNFMEVILKAGRHKYTEFIIGIDLGTAYTSQYIWDDGNCVVVTNKKGEERNLISCLL